MSIQTRRYDTPAERADAASAPPLSAADILVRQLAAAGVDYFFGNGGTDFPPIVEAFARAAKTGTPAPKPMVVPHETAAAAMAYGHTLISGRPQAVMVHVNVGSANALNIVLNASRDNIPLLLFAGRTPFTEAGPAGTRSRYIHWGQEMFDQAGMLREAVKWDYELHLPQQIGDIVARGMEVAMTAPRGPVYVTLARDVLAAPVPALAPAPMRAAPSEPHPAPAVVARIAERIAAAERPLLITANAGRTREGFHALSVFADRFAIPVVSFNPRYLNLPSSHPMNFGFEPRPLLSDADLVLVLDCDVPWIPSLEGPPDDCCVIHVAEDPAFVRYPMRNFPSTLSLTANSVAAIQALNAALAEWMPPSDRRILTRRARLMERAKTEKAKTRSAAPAVPPSTGAVTPEWISACIAEAVGDDAIIVNEYPLRLAHCRREQSGSYFGLSPAGGLGWGFGAALGVKLAAPERLVVATLGDGAYIFANPPACHFVSQAHDIPVLVVIFNNQLYGAVRNATRAMYGSGEAMKEGGRLLADLSPAPAYERYAEASGGYGERVDRAAELPAALRRAIHAVTVERRQALLNVICDY